MQYDAPPPHSLVPVGRNAELRSLASSRRTEGVRLVRISGARGTGKTALLAHAFPEGRVLHFRPGPLPEPALLGDFERLLGAVLGQVPRSAAPGLLPRGSGGEGWLPLLFGIQEEVAATGEPMVLILDGVEPLVQCGRSFRSELGEFVARVRKRALPMTLVLAAHDERRLEELLPGEDGHDLRIHLEGLPFRAAGWAHGAISPEDAFHRWAILGNHPAHLPRESFPACEQGAATGEGWREAVIRRVLEPGGDLFDRPLGRLNATFRQPTRYAAILRSLARGPLDWATLLGETPGIDTGGQLAPYLRRLEEEGLVRVEHPLDAPRGSRRRRYALADPFLAFWFGLVLPVRSLLGREPPEGIWRRWIEPGLGHHLGRRLAEAAREWIRDHALERLGARAREAGALWGGEAHFDVAARLENGHVCYGLVRWEGDERALVDRMTAGMAATRYGLGREARVPLFFVREEGGEALRREVARDGLARVIGIERLMGPPPGMPGIPGQREG